MTPPSAPAPAQAQAPAQPPSSQQPQPQPRSGWPAGAVGRLLPLAELPAARLAGLRGVLTDIDDTLTQDGAIAPEALAALHALAAAGLPVVAVTGRPAGWSLPMVQAWPVAAIVAENGAVMLRRRPRPATAAVAVAPVAAAHPTAADPTGAASPAGPASPARPTDTVLTDFVDDAATREANARRLQACAQAVLAEVPGATLADDSAGRLTDIAIDHSEHRHLDAPRIAQVVALMHAHGLSATVSSIHINGWFGDHDKASGARWAVQAVLGEALQPERWLYVGDSTNDQAMFAWLPLTVGVANIARFLPQLRAWPAYLTQAERGQGFAEVARALLAARAG